MQAITVSVTNLWKKPLRNVVILKDVVVLLGVVGAPLEETIWLILDSNLELVHKFNLMQLLKKYHGL